MNGTSGIVGDKLQSKMDGDDGGELRKSVSEPHDESQPFTQLKSMESTSLLSLVLLLDVSGRKIATEVTQT